MRRGGDKVGVSDRAGVQPRHHQAGDVGYVRQQIGAHFARDLAHPREIDDARVGAGADGDHLRLMLACQRRQLVVVDPFVVPADTIVDNLKEFAGALTILGGILFFQIKKGISN